MTIMDDVDVLVGAMLSRDAFMEAPVWYAQLRYAQALHCPPWELDEAFVCKPVERSEWVQRMGLVMKAEEKARHILGKRRT